MIFGPVFYLSRKKYALMKVGMLRKKKLCCGDRLTPVFCYMLNGDLRSGTSRGQFLFNCLSSKENVPVEMGLERVWYCFYKNSPNWLTKTISLIRLKKRWPGNSSYDHAWQKSEKMGLGGTCSTIYCARSKSCAYTVIYYARSKSCVHMIYCPRSKSWCFFGQFFQIIVIF